MSDRLRTLDKRSRAGCQSCPRLTAQYVPPALVVGSPLLMLAEAPGEKEAVEGEVLVGPSGKLLTGLLTKVGIDREQVSLVNTVACYLPGNPTPTATEIKCCAPVVEEAIGLVRPKVIVALGGVAIARMVGARPVKPWQGSVMTRPGVVSLGEERILGPDVFKSGKRKGEPKPHLGEVMLEQPEGRKVVVTFHPAALLDSGLAEYPLVVAALRRAKMLAQGTPLIEFGREIVGTPQDPAIMGIVLEATRGKEIVLDVETDGKGGRLTLVGLAPDEHYGVTFRPSVEIYDLLRKALGEKDRTLIGHNLDFDVKVLEDVKRWGAGVFAFDQEPLTVKSKLWDTMHACHLERPNLAETIKPKALDTALSRFAEIRWYNYKQAFRSQEAPDLSYYNAMDCTGTALLRRLVGARLAATGRLRHFEEHLMRALPVLIDLEQEGVRVDEELLKELAEKQADLAVTLQHEFSRLSGEVNYRSNPQLRAYVKNVLKLPVPMIGRGKTRRESLNEEACQWIAKKHPEAESLGVLVKLRHAEKVLATWLTPEVVRGRVHPSYNLSGTEWGRLSGDMQQVPRPGGACEVSGCSCKRVREVFVPDDGDWAWVSGDFSQGEFRLWGPLAGDAAIARIYAPGGHGDIHRWAAERFGLTKTMPLKEARNKVKPAVHGASYGRGEVAIAKDMGVSVSEAVAFLQVLRSEFRRTEQYKRELVEHVRRHGWIANPFGRRAYFEGKAKETEIWAANPQSTLGDMGVIAGTRAAEAGLKVRLFLHDEIGISARWEGEMQVLKQVMEKAHPEIAGGWSCPADVGSGKSWAEAKR